MDSSLLIRWAVDAFLGWVDHCEGELRLPVRYADPNVESAEVMDLVAMVLRRNNPAELEALHQALGSPGSRTEQLARARLAVAAHTRKPGSALKIAEGPTES